jgi:hypothetical protein
LLVPDPHDCILSKLERASPKDRDDADYLFRSQKLDPRFLRERYKNELRHNLIGNLEWHDQALIVTQYILGCRPGNKSHDARWRKIKVKLRAPKGFRLSASTQKQAPTRPVSSFPS